MTDLLQLCGVICFGNQSEVSAFLYTVRFMPLYLYLIMTQKCLHICMRSSEADQKVKLQNTSEPELMQLLL